MWALILVSAVTIMNNNTLKLESQASEGEYVAKYPTRELCIAEQEHGATAKKAKALANVNVKVKKGYTLYAMQSMTMCLKEPETIKPAL